MRDLDRIAQRPSTTPATCISAAVERAQRHRVPAPPARRRALAQRATRSPEIRLSGAWRELARLVQSGLVTARAVGNQKHVQANAAPPLFGELHGIVLKTIGLAEPLRDALRPLVKEICAAFVYGSVAKRQDDSASDVDLMLISDSLTYADVFFRTRKSERAARQDRQPDDTLAQGSRKTREERQRVRQTRAFAGEDLVDGRGE